MVVNVVPTPYPRAASIRFHTAGYMEAPLGSLRVYGSTTSGTSPKCSASHSDERVTRAICGSVISRSL